MPSYDGDLKHRPKHLKNLPQARLSNFLLLADAADLDAKLLRLDIEIIGLLVVDL